MMVGYGWVCAKKVEGRVLMEMEKPDGFGASDVM